MQTVVIVSAKPKLKLNKILSLKKKKFCILKYLEKVNS